MAARSFLRNVLKVRKSNLPDLGKLLRSLVDKEVLVGFPEETATRDDTTFTNAAIAYVQDNGAPEQNIPARPFMIPGVESVEDGLADGLIDTVDLVVKNPNDPWAADKGLTRVGLKAVLGIRRKIDEGIPPPLAEVTLMDRARRGRKGAAQELANRAAGLAASTQLAKPLVDTGEMRKSVTYVIRSRKSRK